jgi:hypothetical protein
VLKLSLAIYYVTVARFNFNCAIVERIASASFIRLLYFFDVARALQEFQQLILANCLPHVQLFWRRVNSRGPCEDFASQQVVNAPGKDGPVVDQKTNDDDGNCG